MEVEVIFCDSQVPLEQSQELLLHEIHFGQSEAKVLKATDGSVSSPMFVLWRGVIEVLGG